MRMAHPGREFCGILAESLAPGVMAVGIGVNVAHVPDNLSYKATYLDGISLESFFQELSLSLSYWLEIWDDGRGFPAVISAWEKRCKHIGLRVSVGEEQGTFAGLAPDGALLLKKSFNEIKPIYAGDVRVEYQSTQ